MHTYRNLYRRTKSKGPVAAKILLSVLRFDEPVAEIWHMSVRCVTLQRRQLSNRMKKNTEKMAGFFSKQDPIKLSIILIIGCNLLSIFFFMASSSRNVARGQSTAAKETSHNIVQRSERFVPSKPGVKVIHVVKDEKYDWQEPEFTKGFESCPHFSNCMVETHMTTATDAPTVIPRDGAAVVITAQAAATHPNAAWWRRARELRNEDSLWVIQAMLDPYHAPLDFLDDAGFNLTMTYKPDADIFTPHNFWLSDSDNSVRFGMNMQLE